MIRVGPTTTFLALAVGYASIASAHAADVDWKMYGRATIGLGPKKAETLCFYDTKGVTQRPDQHIRVWTKCLTKKELDDINPQKDYDGRILENTARKIVGHYVPPIASTENATTDQMMAVTQYEETADISSIQPASRILYEINCSEQMLQELSISLQVDGKNGGNDTAAEWRHVAPETNGARLLKIICPKQ